MSHFEFTYSSPIRNKIYDGNIFIHITLHSYTVGVVVLEIVNLKINAPAKTS